MRSVNRCETKGLKKAEELKPQKNGQEIGTKEVPQLLSFSSIYCGFAWILISATETIFRIFISGLILLVQVRRC